MKDVIIIGAGPAGLSASVYAARANLSTLVISGDTEGGLITTTERVDNYLGLPEIEGLEMGKVFVNHAKNLGVELESGFVKEITKNPDETFTVTLDNDNTLESKAVIYAAGSTPRKLNVPGEESNGVSYCATCDGAFSFGEDVIVVGGGESAAEEALYMSNIAASTTLLIRGAESKASAPLIEKVKNAGVNIEYNTQITEISENESLLNVQLNNGGIKKVNSVFIAVGQIPNSSVVKDHSLMNSEYEGFVHCSSTKGLFIAGDVCNPEYRQAIIAAGDGAKAGIDAVNYIMNS